jgi:hypothetical protein
LKIIARHPPGRISTTDAGIGLKIRKVRISIGALIAFFRLIGEIGRTAFETIRLEHVPIHPGGHFATVEAFGFGAVIAVVGIVQCIIG